MMVYLPPARGCEGVEGARGKRYGLEVSEILLRRRDYNISLLGTIEDAI